jgi:predicted GIY-YIG superfamily endonuclease
VPPKKQITLKVGRETAGRRGKGVTTVFDLPLNEVSVLELAATLKQRCGTGGTVKDGRIEIQGDQRCQAVPIKGKWFVYMLRCRGGSLYTGITNDVSRRCKQHNAGTASRYTRSRRPTRLVYHEPKATRSLALKREAAIKGMKKRDKEVLIRLAG